MKTIILLGAFLFATYCLRAQNWLTNGNSGLSASNFLGTTDGQSLKFKTNNQVSGVIDFAAGVANTSLGYQSLRINTGNNNAALGYKAMFANTQGRVNTAMGAYALYNNNRGYSNIGVGIAALFGNKNLNNLVAIGDSALYNNSFGSGRNTAVGSKSMYTNLNGYFNTALGYNTLFFNSTGYINTAVGYNALYRNTGGSSNTAIGASALYNSLYGFNNTAVGSYSLFFDSAGYLNTAIGTSSLYLNGDGNYNSAVGHNALTNNSSGSYNTAVGVFALNFNTVGDHLTGIGYSTGANAVNYTNSTALGFAATITASNQVRIGNDAITSIGGYVNWSNISDARVKKNVSANVPGLAFINRLQPVTYNLDLYEAEQIILAGSEKNEKETGVQSEKELDNKRRKESNIYTGFIAQDVEKIAKEINFNFSGIDAPKNEKDLYGLRYAEFVVPLVKAVQELSQQNIELIKRLEKIEAYLKEQTIGNDAPSILKYSSTISATIDQNVPNPFKNNTVINYTLPQQYTSAKIIISDNRGKMLREINISGKDKGSFAFNSAGVAAGAYNYAYYINGRLIDTKQMIIAR